MNIIWAKSKKRQPNVQPRTPSPEEYDPENYDAKRCKIELTIHCLGLFPQDISQNFFEIFFQRFSAEDLWGFTDDKFCKFFSKDLLLRKILGFFQQIYCSKLGHFLKGFTAANMVFFPTKFLQNILEVFPNDLHNMQNKKYSNAGRQH